MRRGVGLGAVKRDDGAWGLATRPFAKTFEDTDEDGCKRERAGERRKTGMRGAHPREGKAPILKPKRSSPEQRGLTRRT